MTLAPENFKVYHYIDILFKYLEALIVNKYDFGQVKSFSHQIILKNEYPVYSKQFKISKARHHFFEQTLDEWLKIAVVKILNSLLNSLIFCIPKKQGQGFNCFNF
jgi:hypothetical protein